MSGGVAGDPWDFFVSYTRSDGGWAEWIAWVLEEAGFRVLVQKWDFTPGSNWVSQVNDGVSRSRRTVAVLSGAYQESAYCQAEWQAAWQRDPGGADRKLLVFRVEDCPLPGLLEQIVSADLFGLVEGDAEQTVVRAARSAAGVDGRGKPAQRPSFPLGRRWEPGRAAFPGMGGAHPARTQPASAVLPGLPGRFVARDADVAAVRGLLVDANAGPVVGMVAMGGAGKSTLARALVHDEQVRAAFPDGIVWVEVNPHPDLAALQTQILAAFGFVEPVVDVQAGSARLRELLAGAVCLIVADNVWEPEVLAALSVPTGSRLLVTTRDRDVLFTDSEVYRLGRVGDATARRLLARYAGCETGELPAEAAEIIRRCDGLVLAIVIVGGMVGEGRGWATVVDRLRRADLDGLRARFADYPHGLLAALASSVEALGEKEADRFAELVVFEGRGPVPVAAAVLLWQATGGVGAQDAEELVSRLGRRSLVQFDPVSTTFTLHDLLFDYVRGVLGPGRCVQVHGVLARCLLSWWDGPQGLGSALAVPAEFGAVDRYGLSSLVTHLLAAGEPEMADAVLAAERPSQDGRVESVWYGAHEARGTTGVYLADVRAARQDAATRFLVGDPQGLARHVWYCLILGSIASLAANIPPALLARLVETGRWPLARAVTYAQSAPTPGDRVRALAALSPYLPADRLARVLADASAVEQPFVRAQALSLLAPWLPAPQREAVLTQALADASTANRPEHRARILSALAPQLPAGPRRVALAQALTDVAAIGDPGDRGGWGDRALASSALVSQVSAGQRRQVFAQALSDALAWRRWRCLWVSRLPAAARRRALTRALTLLIARPMFGREGTVAGLVPYLSADQLPRVVVAATALDSPYYRGRTLAVLAPYLTADQRASVLDRALAAVTGIDRADNRALTLAELAPYLSVDQLDRALSAATAIDQPDVRAGALSALAPHLCAEQRRPIVDQALTAADAIDKPIDRAQALTSLVRDLVVDQHGPIVAQALAAIGAIKSDQPRAGALAALVWALAALVPRLPADQREPAIDQALTMAIGISDQLYRALAVKELAPLLPVDQLGRALTAMTAIFTSWPEGGIRAAVALAPHLSAEQLGEVVTAVDTIYLPVFRRQALAELAPYLPVDQLARALVIADAIDAPYERSRALTALAPYLPAEQRGPVLARALAAATATVWAYERVRALAVLLPQLPADQCEAAAVQALIAASTIDRPYYQAQAWAALAPHLPAEQGRLLLARALTAAAIVYDPQDRAEVLTAWAQPLLALVPRLPADQRGPVLVRVLTVAADIDESDARGRALTVLEQVVATLVPQLPPDERGPVLAQALTAASTVSMPQARAKILTALVPRLPAEQRASALAQAPVAATDIFHADARARAVAALAPHLPADQLVQALTAASSAGRQAVIDVLPLALAHGDERGSIDAAVVAALLRAQRWWP
ncbi:TIR domain-containing protein [Frankia sp. Ag45/Mut15]|uniref:TIR domain-containing protein n=1 Tax=Frankia umida TaxID=573489 RepID=A0ABT0K2X0_9ACTN|nr:toll/interleukin-1 receptor domain-containing protein [Frankia umida]MCK9877854.1 TIR domain-containing protein [Frankia umida]